jgi:hypothetical protein
MKKPMKPKRYADGDVVEDDFKKKGLESSKGDRVSLLERLRMGNIDDPKSEAYRRYGAGRGRTDADTASRMKDRATVNAAPNQDISRMGSSGSREEVSSPFLMGRTQIGSSRETPSMFSESSDDLQRRANMGEPAQSAMGTPPASTEVVKSTAAKITKPKGSSLPRNRNAPKYNTGDEGPAQIGNQNTFNMDKAFKPKMDSDFEDVNAPGARAMEKNVREFKGVKSASGNDWLTPPKYGANKISDEEAAQLEKKRSVAKAKKIADAEALKKVNKSKSSTSLKAPGFKMDVNDPFSMTLGSDLDPKSMMRNNPRLSGDMDHKKGGRIKASNRFASGGSISSASKRGDGIAQKGKTKGRMV